MDKIIEVLILEFERNRFFISSFVFRKQQEIANLEWIDVLRVAHFHFSHHHCEHVHLGLATEEFAILQEGYNRLLFNGFATLRARENRLFCIFGNIDDHSPCGVICVVSEPDEGGFGACKVRIFSSIYISRFLFQSTRNHSVMRVPE